MAKNYKLTPKRPGSEAEAVKQRGQDAVARRQKTPVEPIIFDKGATPPPSSSKHDAKVSPRNTGANGGTDRPVAPNLAPDMSKVKR